MNDWKKEFEAVGAIWVHDGNPKRPHAQLTSGMCSDGFVNCTLITQRPALLKRILTEPDGLSPQFPDAAQGERVDWVIGSALGAVSFSYAVAERLNAQSGYTEKDGEAMKLARFEVAPKQWVLVVEDVISTGGSTLKTIEAIETSTSGQASICSFIVCLVNRSGKTHLGPHKIRSLITPDIHTWKPEECPLCKKGSKAVRPKSHWKELTAQY